MYLIFIAFAVILGAAAVLFTYGFISWIVQDTPSAGELLAALTVLLGIYGSCAFLFLLARRRARRDAQRFAAMQAEDIRRQRIALFCPKCKDTEVVHGFVFSIWSPHRGKPAARCLSCGHRWSVDPWTWHQLPSAQVGDPFENYYDRARQMRCEPMTAGHLVMCMVGVVVGSVVTVVVSVVAGLPSAGAPAPLLGVYAGWRAGRRWFPPQRRPGLRCVVCGYRLQGLPEPRCPECGSVFDPEIVAAQTGSPLVITDPPAPVEQ